VCFMATSLPDAGLGGLPTPFELGSFVGLSDAQLLERYTSEGGRSAEVAFAAMVERHGPTVLRVCNSVLGDPHDAQDAAQVTFLLLARRAGAIRRRNALASWLFQVARRVAARAKVEGARRRLHERRRAEMAKREQDRRSSTGEACEELFEEIDRLSEHRRSAIVLCDLEGLTHEQAAQRLDCPVKTLQGRLYRAREQLRHRLTRRGFATTAGMAGIALAQQTASAAPSAAWVAGTARAAAQLVAGQGVERLLSPESALLFRQVLRAMTLSKLTIGALGGVALTASAVGMVVAGGGRRHSQVEDRPRPNDVPPAAKTPMSPAAEQQLQNNLKRVGLAMANYHGAHHRFPAAAIRGSDGKPLLSWRVAILPYIEQGELYNKFKLDEPWDSPHNKPLLDRMPSPYASAPQTRREAQGSLTHFRVFVGDGTPFEGGRSPRWTDFSDGPGQTILIAEADEAVPWTKPDELPYAPDKPLPALGGGTRGSFLVEMANGMVLTIPANFDEVLLRRAITVNDRQPVDLDAMGIRGPSQDPSGHDTTTPRRPRPD
jgi:RNA polymerase sigma factor (sigma-70 family)